jgi:hypothetical protein
LKGEITMTKIEFVKLGVGFVVSYGASAIVNNAIRATTPGGLHIIKRASIFVGTFVISSIVCDAAVRNSNQQIDTFVANFDKIFDTANKLKKILNKEVGA